MSTMTSDASKQRLEPFKVACSSCNLRELCLPVGLSSENLDRLDSMVLNAPVFYYYYVYALEPRL